MDQAYNLAYFKYKTINKIEKFLNFAFIIFHGFSF